jgi:hypothetical protein
VSISETPDRVCGITPDVRKLEQVSVVIGYDSAEPIHDDPRRRDQRGGAFPEQPERPNDPFDFAHFGPGERSHIGIGAEELPRHRLNGLSASAGKQDLDYEEFVAIEGLDPPEEGAGMGIPPLDQPVTKPFDPAPRKPLCGLSGRIRLRRH